MDAPHGFVSIGKLNYALLWQWPVRPTETEAKHVWRSDRAYSPTDVKSLRPMPSSDQLDEFAPLSSRLQSPAF
jgi:hypothetical protein